MCLIYYRNFLGTSRLFEEDHPGSLKIRSAFISLPPVSFINLYALFFTFPQTGFQSRGLDANFFRVV